MFNLKILHHNKMPFLHELEKAFEERFSNQLYQATVMADNTLSPLKLKSREWITYRMFSRWLLCGKVELIHGGHIKNFLFPEVDIEASNKWWTNGVLFYETEAPLTLIQDASIAMNNYIQYIFMTRRSPTRIAGHATVKRKHLCIQHMTSACRMFMRFMRIPRKESWKIIEWFLSPTTVLVTIGSI